ncbi:MULTISPECIES: Crp/Fnr family transcriptional regulator [Breznakia]|uniref:CRP-like cAMP-binding protein n=1 Tax=Breznakia blatticola TaxID=1754012 RepID=A0A4R8A704_9FIRM|nr:MULTISPECIES: Crp/Fnr family transcriptional regulator [Breznakia]MDH6365973.1 CRP-like cAMP-binding protein [Breznakia sp. PH1-1]MDH6403095.1 CRP-like cAMP-binding protein [Breznakia sp. PF1-11]MDH6410804.1 CRP-like cAMP-binding protein [Breznakia sp. PFB1-11]MDH6413139.1 CRP-like cAMP-binding protein [Breznakia sp. PFB1-14]MDH6415507.1 CRP-like cAMP-binding protein [Breznakia sp. PFB1-4]
MNKIFQMIYAHPLFKGLKNSEVQVILESLHRKTYDREQTVFAMGESQYAIGFILKGNVTVSKLDYWGNRSIVNVLGKGEIFCESFAFSRVEELPVNVVAHKDSDILFITGEQFIDFGVRYPQLMKNMMYILSSKNVFMSQKMDILSKRKIRDKVLAFLSMQAQQQRNYRFSIPFNRNELADYLSVDRSALSAELSKMRDEGIIDYHLSEFTIY